MEISELVDAMDFSFHEQFRAIFERFCELARQSGLYFFGQRHENEIKKKKKRSVLTLSADADNDSLAALDAIGNAAGAVEAHKDKSKFLSDNQLVFFERTTFEFLRGPREMVFAVQAAPECQQDLVARFVDVSDNIYLKS